MKDYYQLLGIPPEASADEITRAFRLMAQRYHPDRNPHRRRWAEARFKEIREAYVVLRDEAQRREYDRRRRTSLGDRDRSRKSSTATGQRARARETKAAQERARPQTWQGCASVRSVKIPLVGVEIGLLVTSLDGEDGSRSPSERDR